MLTDFLLRLEEVFVASPGLGLLASFLAGVLVSFSPCIYPLIPITVGVIGSRSVDNKSHGFIVSLVFVLGVAFMYTAVGIIASLMGIFLFKFFINPITYLLLALVFIAFGLYLLDVLRLDLVFPGFSPKPGGKGLVSIFSCGQRLSDISL